MKHLLVLVLATLVSVGAQAQDIGFIAGIGNTSADIDNADVNAELGYRIGVNVKLDLVDQVSFRTGGTYTARPFNIESTALVTDLDVKMTYIDIPALFQFSFNDMISIYGGPVVALNVGEKAEGTILGVAYDGDVSDIPGQGKTKSLYLLAQVGVNFNFDGIGFDLYYERGLGEINKDGAENYSIMGANFLYWF